MKIWDFEREDDRSKMLVEMRHIEYEIDDKSYKNNSWSNSIKLDLREISFEQS